jgi:hypothetical protein
MTDQASRSQASATVSIFETVQQDRSLPDVTSAFERDAPYQSHPIASRTLLIGAVLVSYLALGIAAFWPLLPGLTHRLFGTGSDSILAMWFLGWIPHSLHDGLNPFYSHSIFVPYGVNLAQNTESPFLGLLTVPLAPFANPVARADILMILAMPISAAAAFFVLLRWKLWMPAAAIGGVIYGFSPYAIGQSLGHVVLVFTPIPPLVALTLVAIVQRRGGPLRLGIQLGLLLSLQFLSEPEVMVSVAIVSVWALACTALVFRTLIRDLFWPCLKPMLIGVGVSALVLAYPIWMMTAGPQHYTGPTQPANNGYYNDVLSFVLPGTLQENSFGLSSPAALVNRLTNPSEAGGYIGIGLLVLSGFLFWRSRKSVRMRVVGATLLGAIVLSLGPHLVVDGVSTHIPLPFLVISHIPLLDNLLASRFSLEIALCLGALIAFGLDDLRRVPVKPYRHSRTPGRTAAIAFSLITVVVLVVTQMPQWPFRSQAVLPMPSAIRGAIPGGNPTAITYPYSTAIYAESMLWQADADYSFDLTGGYSNHPTPQGLPTGFPRPLQPPGLENFLYGQEGFDPYIPPEPITPMLIDQTRTAFAHYYVRLVIVDRSMHGSARVMDLFTTVLGEPKVATPSFALWASRQGPL